MAATLRRRMPESNAVTCCWDRNGQTRRQRPGVMVVGDGWVVRRPCVRNKTTMTTELSMLDGSQRGHGVSGGHQRCGVGMGGRLAGSICEPHTSARGLVAGRRIRGVQGRQRCACDLGCMWSFGPAPVVLRRAGIMTNRQTRRIWWRRNGRLPACFSASLVLLSNGWRRFSWRCGWLGVPLPRPSPLSLSLFSDDADLRGQQTMPP